MSIHIYIYQFRINIRESYKYIKEGCSEALSSIPSTPLAKTKIKKKHRKKGKEKTRVNDENRKAGRAWVLNDIHLFIQ